MRVRTVPSGLRGEAAGGKRVWRALGWAVGTGLLLWLLLRVVGG